MGDSKPLVNYDAGDAIAGATVASEAAGVAKNRTVWSQILDSATGSAERGRLVDEATSSSPLSSALTWAGAVNSALTHDPAADGAAGVAESVAVGGVEALFGFAGGAVGVVDAFTGGHIAGGLKGGASAATALLTGDEKAMGKATDNILSGKHGKIAQGLGHAGDGFGDWLFGAFNDTGPEMTADDLAIIMEAQRRTAAKGNEK